MVLLFIFGTVLMQSQRMKFYISAGKIFKFLLLLHLQGLVEKHLFNIRSLSTFVNKPVKIHGRIMSKEHNIQLLTGLLIKAMCSRKHNRYTEVMDIHTNLTLH